MSTTPAEIPAESAPAIETPEVSVQERLDGATANELKTWREKGDIPAIKIKTSEAPPKPAESAPASEPAKSDATPAPKSETAAASPAAKPQERETRSEKRWRELSEKFGNLQREHEELKRKTSQPVAASDKPDSQPETGKTQPVKQAKPKLSDNDPKTGKPFATLEAWSDAVDDWHDQRSEERLKSALDERLTKAEQARTQTEEQRRVADEVIQRSKPAMEKYPDFLKVAADPNLPIPAGSPADLFIKESDNPGEVAYYLGKHPEVLAEFYGCTYDPDTKTWNYGDFDQKTGKFTNHVSPIKQVRILSEIERELTAPKPKPKTEAAPPANPPPPKLPAPPPELSGRGATVGDEAEKALQRGDVATYMRLKNQADEKASRR